VIVGERSWASDHGAVGLRSVSRPEQPKEQPKNLKSKQDLIKPSQLRHPGMLKWRHKNSGEASRARSKTPPDLGADSFDDGVGIGGRD
jgi:hypothetical protein